MIANKKIFRVFVSSTFSDMKAERAILQEDVFKRLKEDCRKRGAIFQDIDLRWGVTEEATKIHQTMKICLSEIARCQNISPKPNFIVLLGDRYGWQPLPADIPSDEAAVMKKFMTPADLELFDGWYREDTNAVPALFILQSISDKMAKWAKDEDLLRQLLREVAVKANLSGNQKNKYFASATHQEIISGALNPPTGTFDPKEHVFCYFRKPVAIADKGILQEYIDLDKYSQPDAYCSSRLDSLKAELTERLPHDHIYSYAGVLDNKIVRPDSQREFADRVYGDLKRIIFAQLDEIEGKEEDALTQEIERHNAFMERATIDFTGREKAVEDILAYLSGTDNRVYALIGDSGSGKTSVMAQAATLARQEESSVVIARFLGTTGGSSNYESLLVQIDEEIARIYGVDIDSLRGTAEKRKMEKEVFQECLMLPGKARSLVLFLDALDQLSEFGRQMLMEALPKSLPTFCRIVVSGTSEAEQLFNNTANTTLLPMTKADGEALLTAWLLRSGRKLRDDQKSAIITKFTNNGLPLYLKLLFESARLWHSYDTAVPEIPNDMDGMLSKFFHGLELQHTRELVGTVMGYLLCSRHKGLPENEALELLARDEEYWASFLKKYPYHSAEAIRFKRIPVVLWSRLYLDLEPYLTERTEDGTTLLIFYHLQFGQYTMRAYVRGHEERYCRNLGKYGEEGARLSRETGSPLGYSSRYGLVYYLRAGMDEKVKGLIVWMFSAAETPEATILQNINLMQYVIVEGSEKEKGRYKGILDNCSLEMPESMVWGKYLSGAGRTYSKSVFQQWSIFYYQRAINIGEKIHEKNPDNIDIAAGLARNCGILGYLLQDSIHPEEAEDYHQKAVAMLEKIHKKNPDNIDIAGDLAMNYGNLGVLLDESNRPQGAVGYYQKAIDMLEKIHAENPDNIFIAGVLALNYGNLGSLLQQSNRSEEAVGYYQKAISILEKIHAKNHDDIYIAKGLAANYGHLGVLLQQSNRSKEAVGYYQKATDILEKIHAENPDNIDIAADLAGNYGVLGSLLQDNNHSKEAVGYYQKAIDILENIYAVNPDNREIAASYALKYSNLGSLFQQSNRPQEAMDYYQKAIDILKKIHAENLDNIDIAADLAGNYGKLGSLLQDNDHPKEAVGYYQKAIDILESIHSENSDNIDIAERLAGNYGKLGSLLQQRSRFKEAMDYDQKAIDILERIHAENSGNIDIAEGLARNYGNLGLMLQDSNRPQEAVGYYQKALDIRKDIHESNPDNIDIAGGLATSYFSLGSLLQDSNRPQEAEPFIFKMLQILLNITRKSGRPHQHLQYAVNLYVEVLEALGKNDEQIFSALSDLAPEFFAQGDN